MKMKKISRNLSASFCKARIGYGSFLLLISLLVGMQIFYLAYTVGHASTPPDIIHQKIVEITPMPDGSLYISYELDYEATTDFPSDIQYLEMGVPNPAFSIESVKTDALVIDASANTQGGSWVRLNFSRLPQAGDRFQLRFSILQKDMIYRYEDDIAFQFRPGWYDFAEIRNLRVMLMTDLLQDAKFDPKPQIIEGRAIWIESEMQPGDKMDMIIAAVDKTSFPELTDGMILDRPRQAEDDAAGVIILVVVAVLVLVVILVAALSKKDYDSGSNIGGVGASRVARAAVIGGRAAGCACACACACAGGGRIGCAERGCKIRYWLG